MKRSILNIASAIAFMAVVVLAAAVSPASAASITIQSGNGAIGSPDPAVQVVADSFSGNGEPRPATIVSTHPAWALPLSPSKWVSHSSSAAGGESSTYQTTFTLPAGATSRTLSVTLHADNRAIVSLNGTVFGSQPTGCPFENFQGSPDTFSTSTGFVEGLNTLTIVVENPSACGSGPTGLNFVATVTYEEILDSDLDGIPDPDDNCPNDANTDQLDANNDGVGAACDTQELPLAKEDCKGEGWKGFDGTATFKNQGDCVSYVATRANNTPTG